MSFGLCGHMSAFAQSSNDEGWQSLADFLNQAERVIERQESFDPQALGLGDIISLDIKKVPNLSQNYTIEKNGEIDFPLIGRVNVQGETPEDLAEKLAALYEKDYLVNPSVTVSIFAKRLPTLRPATPIYGPASLALDTKPLALDTLDPYPSNKQQTVTQTVLEALTVLPETAPQIVPNLIPDVVTVTVPEEFPEIVEDATFDIAIEVAPDIAPEPVIEVAPLIAPSPAPQIETSEPLPFLLTDNRWSIEGSSEDFIHFLSNGDMAGALGCNSFFARYDAGQSDINISAVTNTNIPCADQSKPQEFADNLKQAQSYIFSQNNLLLLDEQSQVIFALQPK